MASSAYLNGELARCPFFWSRRGALPNTVLIVDDSAAMRQALCRLFKAAGGFQVCGEASNGQEAIELTRELKPELIVLDLCMPGLNGLETARQLNQLTDPPPIILYSMNAEDIIAKEASALGVSAVVSKAEGIKTLITKARKVLDSAV
jgi:DNA-binding NarL/FixJ family response regulator